MLTITLGCTYRKVSIGVKVKDKISNDINQLNNVFL